MPNNKYQLKPLVPQEEWEFQPQYDERDYPYPLTATYADMQEDIINSKRMTHVKKQVNGSCTGESMSYALDWATGDITSGEFVYLMAKKYDGFEKNVEGSSLLAVCKAAQKDGVCLDSLYPRVGLKPWYKYPEPSKKAIQDAQTRRIDEYYQISTIEQLHHALKTHGKAILGVLVTTSFMKPETNKEGEAFVDLPSGYIHGAHAIIALDSFPNLEFKYQNGVTRKGFVRVLNSWGTSYGKHGYFYLPYDFIIKKEKDLGLKYTMDMRVPVTTSLINKATVVDIDVAPFTMRVPGGDRTFLPIRHLVENIGAKVNWYQKEGRVEIIKDDITVNMFVNSTISYINGKKKEMDIAPFSVQVPGGERVMLPIRWVTEFLGGFVDYQGGDRRIQTSLNNKNVYMFIDRKYLVIK